MMFQWEGGEEGRRGGGGVGVVLIRKESHHVMKILEILKNPKESRKHHLKSH